jgi:pentatricopeptide repeat protein
MKNKDVHIWNTYLRVLAQGGKGKEAISVLHEMIQASIEPNEVSYVQVIVACSYSSMVQEVGKVFQRAQYIVTDTIRTCMVDVYARSGHLEQAEALAKQIKRKAFVAWTSVLEGCKRFRDYERAARIYGYISHLPAAHVLLGSIVTAGKHEQDYARNKDEVLPKIPAAANVLVNNVMHTFVVEDAQVNPEILRLLSELHLTINNEYAYVPDTSCVSKQLDTYDEKVAHLWQHCEKLALSFALLKTTEDVFITVGRPFQ